MDEVTKKPSGANQRPSGNLDATVRFGEPFQKQGGSEDRTVKPGTPSPMEMDSQMADFTLKGRMYRTVRSLSDSSGEAQVFLVEGMEGLRVLKVYYPNFIVKKELMRIVQNFNFEMLVNVTDYGKTYVEGKNRDYELMEYLQGGSLADYQLNGDFRQFRRIALQAAAALAYCHQNNVIHKDIKPSNFLFRDKDHKELVLSDFGISSLLEDNEQLHRTTQARTPVYAAPEMYSDVIDGEVEISPAADYYSLGLTLMTLWLGENPLSQNERVMMRKKNEGRLPRINELPDRVKMIVQGLTTVNPGSRWGYDEVERWFQGEDVKVDVSSPLLKYHSFVVDPERNLVADNVHELIPLLLDNERLAVNYLYSGRIAEWLEQSGNVKLSAVVKDIVINRYPADQHAGLMSSIYVMEPSYPYTDLRGNQCGDIHSVAISILSNQEEYTLALRNPNDTAYLYIETHTKANVKRLRSYFSKDNGIEPRVAMLCMAYEIDPEIPFLVKHPSLTIKEIVHTFGYEDCSEDEWMSLSDGRLLSWMYSHEDKMTCEAISLLIQGHLPSRALGYQVLYNIDREAAYDLREADTPQKVGEYLCQQMREWESLNAQEFAEKISDYAKADGRFNYYAQLHGWYEQINEAKACFDLKSEENRERLGAYDLRTAAYRFCRILGCTPTYVLDNGIELKNGADLTDGGTNDSIALRPLLLSACRRGALSQWMSVFYHEDPEKTFDEPYSYERCLEEWVLKLGSIDQNQMYYKRYGNARQETERRVKEVVENYQRAKNKENLWRVTFYVLSGVWALLLLIFGIENKESLLEHSTMAIVLPVGGITALIVALRFFFKGYGFIFCSLFGLLGLATSWIPVKILEYVHGNYPTMFVPAILVITLIYIVVCHLTDFRTDSKGDKQLIDSIMEDDVKTTLLEPLHYTFKQKSYRFKGSKFAILDDVNNQVRSISGESVMHYILWTLMVASVILEMVLFSPKLGDMNLPGEKPTVEGVVKQLQGVTQDEDDAQQETEDTENTANPAE